MINNKVKIAICIIVIALMVLTVTNIFGSGGEDATTEIQESTTTAEVQYDDETGEYYITDENGEITHTAESEEDLYIYTIDPDYDPKSSGSDTEETERRYRRSRNARDRIIEENTHVQYRELPIWHNASKSEKSQKHVNRGASE